MTVFEDIRSGLTDAIAFAKGKADPATFRVHVPAEIDVAAIRGKLKLTQAEFAAAYGFPIGTVREWEQRRSRPDTSARAYLLVIERQPVMVRQALGEVGPEAAGGRTAPGKPKSARSRPKAGKVAAVA